MSNEAVFFMVIIGIGAWQIYMMTCRPEQWREIRNDTRERNRKLLDGSVKAGKFIFEAYRKTR